MGVRLTTETMPRYPKVLCLLSFKKEGYQGRKSEPVSLSIASAKKKSP